MIVYKSNKGMLLLLCLTLFLAGCYNMPLDTNALKSRVYLSSESGAEYTRKGDFTTSSKAAWAFFGAIPLKKADLANILDEEISKQNGDAVINLTIKTQHTFVDQLIGAVTLTLYHPRTVFLTGTVISINNGVFRQPQKEAQMVFVENGEKSYFLIPGIINANTLIHFN